MVTKVGMQYSFSSAIQDLLELEYDIKDAYKAAIDRMTNDEYKSYLKEFVNDHDNFIEQITELLKKHKLSFATAPNTMSKNLVTKGRVLLANMRSDEAIISAMVNNEEELHAAYKKLRSRDDVWDEAEMMLKEALDKVQINKANLERIKSGLEV